MTLPDRQADLNVNGELVTISEIHARTAELRAEYTSAGRNLSLEERSSLRTEATELLVDRILLVQEARRLRLEPTETDVQDLLAQLAGRYDGVAGCRAGSSTPYTSEDLRRRMMVDRILARWRASVRPPRPEEVSKHYTSHRERFYAPEQVNVAHIVCSYDRYIDPERAKRRLELLRERVSGGESFGTVAALDSDCPEHNGELGWIFRGVMVKEFDDIVFSAEPGQLTPIFETVFGFHFAFVHARKPEGVRPLPRFEWNCKASCGWQNRIGKSADGCRNYEIGRR